MYLKQGWPTQICLWAENKKNKKLFPFGPQNMKKITEFQNLFGLQIFFLGCMGSVTTSGFEFDIFRKKSVSILGYIHPFVFGSGVSIIED